MRVILYKPRFAPLVLAGTKRQTFRPTPKRPIPRGTILSHRQWSGLPYRTPQIRLCETKCRRTVPHEIDQCGLIWRGHGFDQYLFTPAEAEAFARADGFRDHADMLEWFTANHDLPFRGLVIFW